MPTKLTIPPDQASYSVKDGKETVAIQLDGGFPRYRRDILESASIVNVVWTLTEDQFQYIRAFYNSVTASGSLPFLIDLYLDLPVLTEHQAYFVPDTMNFPRQRGLSFQVSAQLSVKPLIANALYDQSIVDLYNAYGSMDQARSVLNQFEQFSNVDAPLYFGEWPLPTPLPPLVSLFINGWPSANASTSSTSVINPTNGDPIPYIIDDQGSTLAQQLTVADQPAFIENAVNGQPVARFVAGDHMDVLDDLGSPLALAQPIIFALVCNFTIPVSDELLWGDSGGVRCEVGVDGRPKITDGTTSIKVPFNQVDATDEFTGGTLSPKWLVTTSGGQTPVTQSGGKLRWNNTINTDIGESDLSYASPSSMSDGTFTLNDITFKDYTLTGTQEDYIFWRFSVNSIDHTWRCGRINIDDTWKYVISMDLVTVVEYAGDLSLRLHHDGANWLAQYNTGSGWVTAASYPDAALNPISLKITQASLDIATYPRTMDIDSITAVDVLGDPVKVGGPWDDGVHAFHGSFSGATSNFAVDGGTPTTGTLLTTGMSAPQIGANIAMDYCDLKRFYNNPTTVDIEAIKTYWGIA